MKKIFLPSLLLLLVAACSPSGDNEEKKIEPGRVTGDVTIGKTKIHFTEDGDGDTTLLFIHGWAIDGSYWNGQLDHFRDRYHVVAIDLPGFGQSTSDRTDWTIESHAEDVANFIRKRDLKNVILIGHSMSGDVIVETALKNDPAVIGIVGIDNFNMVGGPFSPEEKVIFDRFVDSMRRNYRQMAPDFADAKLFHESTPDSVRIRVKNDFREANPTVAMSSVQSQVVYGQQEQQKLGQLKYKLYLINSDFNPTDTAALGKYCKSGYEVAYIHATGHYPMIEKPEEFNRLLEATIRRMKK